MDSKTSKANRPTPAKTTAVIIPRIPQEIIEEILDHLVDDSHSLRSCALVSRSWVPPCQRYLFHSILFTSIRMARWLKAFPVPEDSPAHRVRHLLFSIGRYDDVPETFFGYIPWFTNMEGVTLSKHEKFHPLWIPPFWRLPESVTSLTVGPHTGTKLVQIRDIMAELPNLDDLSLSGSLLAADSMTSPGVGGVLRGRFGGRLRLLRGSACEPGVVDMLLEIPTGLHFTEVQIQSTSECLLSTVRLAEACSKTLVKLSYTVSSYHGREAFERSFDFSNFPSIQEVHFGVSWRGGGDLLWIPAALSTLKPATSPYLSAIQLDFACPYTAKRSVETVIKRTGNSLLRATDEVSRIEREFKGAVNVTVVRDPWLRVVLDTFNIFQDL